MDPIIQTTKLTKIYHPGKNSEVRALEDVDLIVPGAGLTVIYGPSGSGKSTLLALLGTLERPTSGEILLKGVPLSRYSDAGLSRLRRTTMGFIFQSFQLIPRLSAWENVAFPLIPLGISLTERRNRALRLLEEMGVADRKDHRPEELSGGEQQRVATARALVQDPEIIIADEPTSNIDAEAVDQLLAIFSRFIKRGKTVITASHDPLIREKAHHLFYLQKGRLVSP
jgi:putative ABC transport system ATP-binding protein